MEEKIEVLFGRSLGYPDTIVIEQVRRIGFFEDNDGELVEPEYNAEAESWMARTDMSCSIFEISKSSLNTLTERYIQLIKATWESPCDENKVQQLKEEFLLLANSH